MRLFIQKISVALLMLLATSIGFAQSSCPAQGTSAIQGQITLLQQQLASCQADYDFCHAHNCPNYPTASATATDGFGNNNNSILVACCNHHCGVNLLCRPPSPTSSSTQIAQNNHS